MRGEAAAYRKWLQSESGWGGMEELPLGRSAMTTEFPRPPPRAISETTPALLSGTISGQPGRGDRALAATARR